MDNHDIIVIIPAYNEEEVIGDTINALNQIQIIDRILVIDDGSDDNTSDIAKSHGADVLRLDSNRGKAYAMKKGYETSIASILVFLDADLGSSAKESIKLIDPIRSNEADATIAIFNSTPGKGGFGFVRWLSKWGLMTLTGKSYQTVLSGQRAFKRSRLSTEFFKYKGFGIEFGMMVDLIRNNASIAEIEVDMKHRTTGRDFHGFIHRGKQFKDISKVIISKFVHIRFFDAL